MTEKPRVTRPTLERSAPLRTWSTLFAGADSAQPNGGASATGEAGAFGDVVSRSVDLGYRVVDEYIRQAQKTAQRLNDRTYGTEAMTGDLQDLAMRMTQYASDLAAVWIQLVQLGTTGRPGPSPAPPGETASPDVDVAPAQGCGATTGSPEIPSPPPATARVRIEVGATQPTEVAVDIRPDAIGRALIVHDLRTADGRTPRIRAVQFEPATADTPACVRIRVPPRHPPGVYNGMVIDERTSRPAGTVSVTIIGRRPRSRR